MKNGTEIKRYNVYVPGENEGSHSQLLIWGCFFEIVAGPAANAATKEVSNTMSKDHYYRRCQS